MSLESRLINSGYKSLAVSCIIERNNHLLLIKRNNNPHKGFYCPVGGKVEEFESPKEAIKREVKEETGLEINEFQMAGIMVETSNSKHNWISIIYHSDLSGEIELQQTDEGVLEWVPWSILPQKPLPDTDMPIYKCVKNGQQFVFDVQYDADGEIQFMENELQ